jgi:hypothetical protein
MIPRERCTAEAACQADFHKNECPAECSACGHPQAEHKYGAYRCSHALPGIVGFRPCTCTFVRKLSGGSLALSQLTGIMRSEEAAS